MFKQAKRKIVLSILSILGTVLVATLGMIYISSYLSTTTQNYQVLERQMEKMTNASVDNHLQDGISDPIGNPLQKDKIPRRERIQRNLEVGTFYTVKIYEDGSSEVMENGADGLYTNEELIENAEAVASRTKGKIHGLLYLVKEIEGVTYVCFMDTTVFSDNFLRLFIFTLIFGVMAMLAITFISIYLANRIVSPMEESYQRQKQFTADAGHELKTPVAVVATNLELLRREIGENKWLENISYENERMRDLIIQLLDLARNENQEMERTMTNLTHLVSGAILPHEATAFEKNILIEEDIAEGISAKVNEKSIEQLVAILLDNAISHTPCLDGEFGKVTVRLYESKGNAILKVSNPGEEIPESERKKLFERFYRTDRSHEYTGHYGLGLAIAKSIADANHAGIDLTCENGNVIFTVVFK